MSFPIINASQDTKNVGNIFYIGCQIFQLGVLERILAFTHKLNRLIVGNVESIQHVQVTASHILQSKIVKSGGSDDELNAPLLLDSDFRLSAV